MLSESAPWAVLQKFEFPKLFDSLLCHQPGRGLGEDTAVSWLLNSWRTGLLELGSPFLATQS